MPKLTAKEQELLAALRANVEACDEFDGNGNHWRSVYLDNVDFDRQSFAGVLGSLTKKGLYRSEDEFFGDVKLND